MEDCVPAGNDFVAIAENHHHSLALRADGSLVGWGDNSQGQTNVSTGTFVAIAAGWGHSLAIGSPDPAALIVFLIERVLGLNLQHGIANNLDSKLDAAFQALVDVSKNNHIAAVNALDAFINAVAAQRGKAIPEADADRLIAAATRIIGLLL